MSPARAILVTGASRGLGARMTEGLAADGWTVYAGARVDRPVPDVPGVHRVTLDVTEPVSVALAAAEVGAATGAAGLFAVINNAGVLDAGPLEQLAPVRFERQLRTNVVGPLTVAQAFLPLLREGGGRIVNVGSINGQLPLPFWGAYCASKAALLSLSEVLRMELAPSGVPVSVLTLGAFATDIRSQAQAAWAGRAAGDDPYAPACDASGALVRVLDATAGDPEVVVDAVREVLRAEAPAARYEVGEGIADLVALSAQPLEVREAALQQFAAAAS